MKSFIAKRVISILVNLRYLRFKLLKYKDNNKKICNTFDHNFKNIPLYIMSNVSLERYYFVLYDGALTLKMSKMALNAFCDKTLHIYLIFFIFFFFKIAYMWSTHTHTEGVLGVFKHPLWIRRIFYFFLLTSQRGWWCTRMPLSCVWKMTIKLWRRREKKGVRVLPPPPPPQLLFQGWRSIMAWPWMQC